LRIANTIVSFAKIVKEIIAKATLLQKKNSKTGLISSLHFTLALTLDIINDDDARQQYE
jgi:hypothetical protein